MESRAIEAERGRRRGDLSGRRDVIILLTVCVLLGAAAFPASAQPAGGSPQADRTLRIEAVEILPAEGRAHDVVAAKVRVRPGDAVDDAMLVDLRQRLEDSRDFARVDVFTRPGSRPGLVVLHVEAELDRRVHLLTGFGYEPLDSWYLTLIGAEWRHQPTPGSNVSLALRDGVYVGGLYFAASLADWRLEASTSSQTWFVYEGMDAWTQDITHGLVRAGRRFALGDAIAATAWLGWQWDNPETELTSWETDDEEHRLAAELIPASLAERNHGSLWWEAAWDRRDARQPWRAGAWAGLRARASHLDGGGGFWSAELDARRALPLGDHSALAGHARVAHASDDTPYYHRFPLGGVITNRGYESGRLSEATGACDLWQANLEWRTALVDRDASLPKVTGLLFLDTCQGWDAHGQNLGFGAGIGYGLRVRLPWVQTIGLDVGYPLESPPGAAPFVVHAALGWLH